MIGTEVTDRLLAIEHLIDSILAALSTDTDQLERPAEQRRAHRKEVAI